MLPRVSGDFARCEKCSINTPKDGASGQPNFVKGDCQQAASTVALPLDMPKACRLKLCASGAQQQRVAFNAAAKVQVPVILVERMKMKCNIMELGR